MLPPSSYARSTLHIHIILASYSMYRPLMILHHYCYDPTMIMLCSSPHMIYTPIYLLDACLYALLFAICHVSLVVLVTKSSFLNSPFNPSLLRDCPRSTLQACGNVYELVMVLMHVCCFQKMVVCPSKFVSVG